MSFVNLRDPTLAADTLERLAKEGSEGQRADIARNPNTPLSVLASLVFSFPNEVSENPSLLLFALEAPGPESLYWKIAYQLLVEQICVIWRVALRRSGGGRVLLALCPLDDRFTATQALKKAVNDPCRPMMGSYLYEYAKPQLGFQRAALCLQIPKDVLSSLASPALGPEEQRL